MAPSRRADAQGLAEEILGDIELSRLSPVDIARKTSRLARLLDDVAAMKWLSYEVSGYPRESLDAPAAEAAARSNRRAGTDSSAHTYWTTDLGALAADAESARTEVREHVDAAISNLVPEGLAKLSAAFENATSESPEDWASAAATCRRLLKAAADALKPAGPDEAGRKMGEEQYINRLVSWIASHSESQTLARNAAADLEHLGSRLDAVLEAGNKGAHAEVSRYDASRFVTGTYLLLGDILRPAGQVADTQP